MEKQIQGLSSGDEALIVDALRDVQAILAGSKFKEQQVRVLDQIPLLLLLQAFDTKSYEQLELVTKNMNRLLYIDDEDFEDLQNFSAHQRNILDLIGKDEVLYGFLAKGWGHPFAMVRSLVIEQIKTLSKHKEYTPILFNRPLYLNVLASAVADEELSISKQACTIILRLAKDSDALKQLFGTSTPFTNVLNDILVKSSDVMQMRVLELVVNVALLSDEAFETVANSGLLDNLIAQIKDPMITDNILTLLNVMEITQQLASSTKGFDYLQSRGIFTTLVKILLMNDIDPTLSSFTLSMIASLAETGSDFFSKEDPQLREHIFVKLFGELDNTKVDSVKVALKAIGIVCASSVDAFSHLLSKNSKLTQDGKKYALFMEKSSDVEIFTTFVHSLGQILHSTIVPSEMLEAFVKEIDAQLHDSTLAKQISKQIRDPFPEQRLATYYVIDGLGKHLWGIVLLVQQFPLFVDFMIDRNTEVSKELKDTKYAVVETFWNTLYVANDDKQIISSLDKAKLKLYLQRGPLYVHAEAAVAIASESHQ